MRTKADFYEISMGVILAVLAFVFFETSSNSVATGIVIFLVYLLLAILLELKVYSKLKALRNFIDEHRFKPEIENKTTLS